MDRQEKRFSVRFPLDVLEAIKRAAQEDGRSINREIIWLLQDALVKRKKGDKREKSL